MKKDLYKKILEQIDKTGFPLELRVSKFLRDNDYIVSNNLYYVDLDEGKGREIDIKANKNYLFEDKEMQYYVRNLFFIECKKSKNKPWVIFTSQHTNYNVDLFNLGCKGTLLDRSEIWHVPEIMAPLHKIHPFINVERFGRSYFEAFTDRVSGKAILDSIASSAKAAMIAKMGGSASHEIILHYYPIVVFEGELFEAYLDENEMYVKESDLIYLSFYYQSIKYKGSQFIIPIVKEKALPELMSSFDKILTFLGETVENDLDRFIKRIRNGTPVKRDNNE